MNTTNLIFIGLIFISLVVIIIIFGKNAKKIKNIPKGEETLPKGGEKNPISNFFFLIFKKIRDFFIFLAEWVVKKSKELLHLVHFWLIKIKKGKHGNGVLEDIEAKKELIEKEEENLDKVINEDLGKDEEVVMLQREEAITATMTAKEAKADSLRQNIIQEETNVAEIVIDENGKQIQEEKMEEFFEEKLAVSDEEMGGAEITAQVLIKEDEAEKKSFKKRVFGIFGKKSKEKAENIGDTESAEAINTAVDQNGFSDGIVKIEKGDQVKNEKYIEDVVAAPAGNEFDSDEELGVDRGILEKKILQKIEKNPKDIENFRQLGKLYIKMENFSDAENSYKFILQVSPRDADAIRKLEKIKLLRRLK